jgi:hypothetical protein
MLEDKKISTFVEMVRLKRLGMIGRSSIVHCCTSFSSFITSNERLLHHVTMNEAYKETMNIK